MLNVKLKRKTCNDLTNHRTPQKNFNFPFVSIPKKIFFDGDVPFVFLAREKNQSFKHEKFLVKITETSETET